MTSPPAPDFRTAFARTERLSPFVRRAANARPALVDLLAARDAAPFTREEMRAALEPGPGLPARLRQLRERVMVLLAHRDLNGLAPLDEVFATMTALADECIRAATAQALAEATERYGAPAGGAALRVMALGKLGGEELNVSSDVDLVFLYDHDGETDGPRGVSHQEYFAYVGRLLIPMLADVTGEGQCFRVDMRLRPFGDSGPPVTSFAALEDYFIAHARPWERYAWLKARVVAGPEDGVRERVEPFVYRRYLDYGMLDSLREMHGRIFEAAVQRRKADDIKVGQGGIREVEFAAQLFQMVRGGRDAGLRTTSTRAALRAIAERGLMEPARVAELEAAYAFLRKLEHRLQYYDDQQTQALPRSAEHQALIAEAMGFPDYAALLAVLDAHRARVQAAFGELFSEAQRTPPREAALLAVLFDPQAAPDPDAVAESLATAGIVDAAAVARALIDFTRSRRYRNLSAASRSKLEKLVPGFVAATVEQGGGEGVARRLLDLLEAIDKRDTYYSLLLEFPQVLQRAARLVARSAWVARLLARHPILLDELTRTAASFAATDWPAEREELRRECAELAGDTERLLDHLRHFKHRHVLRLAIAEIEGELAVMALSDELSALADAILDVTLGFAMASVGLGPRRLGDDDASPAGSGVCIVGYGKLGGKELGYASDLDVIFVYDDARAGELEQLVRVAHRVNTWMTALTPAGVLYELDLRLRPDGAKGLMVSSLSGLEEYLRKRAWTWEIQALTRARAAAGDPGVGAAFERLRDAVLATPRDADKLLEEIAAMRARMRGEHKQDAQDLKHVAGGIIDLEFCVQALVLLHGPAHPALRENKGNHTLLRRAAALGIIPEAIAVPAADAYLAMRRRAHDAALNDQEGVRLSGDELAAERAAVRALWDAVLTPPLPRATGAGPAA